MDRDLVIVLKREIVNCVIVDVIVGKANTDRVGGTDQILVIITGRFRLCVFGAIGRIGSGGGPLVESTLGRVLEVLIVICLSKDCWKHQQREKESHMSVLN